MIGLTKENQNLAESAKSLGSYSDQDTEGPNQLA